MFVIVHPVAVAVDLRVMAEDSPLREILKNDGVFLGSSLITPVAFDRPFDRLFCIMHFQDLFFNVLFLSLQYIPELLDVFPVQALFDLHQVHAKRLHILDHIQLGALFDVIVTVPRFRIDLNSAEAASFYRKA